jgi:hypothetical protein
VIVGEKNEFESGIMGRTFVLSLLSFFVVYGMRTRSVRDYGSLQKKYPSGDF